MNATWKPVLLVVLVALLGGVVVSLMLPDPVQGGVVADHGSRGLASTQEGAGQQRVGQKSEDRRLLQEEPTRITKPKGEEPPSTAVSETLGKLDHEALRQVVFNLGNGIEQDRLAWVEAIRDGRPASEILFLQNIMEREELSLRKMRRGEYALVPSAIAMANRKPGDPDFSAYPTTMKVDGSLVYVKIAFSEADSKSLEATSKFAGEQRWIEATSEIVAHNRLSRAERKARVQRSEEAKRNRALLVKERKAMAGAGLSEYTRKLEELRKRELPWYFKIDPVTYLASMPKWAKKFFEDLGGR